MPRVRRLRSSVCLALAALTLALALTSGVAPCDDEKKAPEPRCVQMARAILAAFQANDAKGLERYARVDIPDPWVACFLLCGWGKAPAARALVAAVPRRETRDLPAQIDRWTVQPPSRQAAAISSGRRMRPDGAVSVPKADSQACGAP